MKLYTEEQVKRLLKDKTYLREDTIKAMLNNLKSIKLPSDKEIVDYSLIYHNSNASHIFVFKGAKWIIEQIKQQNNGN